MMSILGATAEDMEEILKGLGYRGEPKTAEEVMGRLEAFDAAARAAEEAKAAEPAAQDHGDEMADPNVPATVAPGAKPQDGVAEANAVDADADQSVAGPDLTAEPVEPDPVNLSHDDVMADPNVSPAPAASAELAPADASPEPAAAAESEAAPEAPAEEPKPVIVWRQGRFGDRNQRHGGQRQGDRRGRHGGGQQGQQEAGEREGGRPRRFDRKGRPGEGEQRGFKGKRPPRDGGGKDKPFRERPPREERPARIDPDSPFAKLAALRDQLKK
jgi:ATP-dependent RNA helicase SUPV3L1/SUV3